MVDTHTRLIASKCLDAMLVSLISNRDLISTPSAESLKATCSIIEKNIENSVGAIIQPCFVPLVTPKDGDISLPSLTVTFMLSWKDLMMPTKCLGHPAFSKMCHSPSLFTVSKALVRSMNKRKRSCCCSLHFSCSCCRAKELSVVLLPWTNPH